MSDVLFLYCNFVVFALVFSLFLFVFSLVALIYYSCNRKLETIYFPGSEYNNYKFAFCASDIDQPSSIIVSDTSDWTL